MVAQHPLSKVLIPLTLYLYMHQHPNGLPILMHNLYELVNPLLALFIFRRQLLQLGIEKCHRLRPIDSSMSLGEKERKEVGKVLL
jgi:hypothetical protein